MSPDLFLGKIYEFIIMTFEMVSNATDELYFYTVVDRLKEAVEEGSLNVTDLAGRPMTVDQKSFTLVKTLTPDAGGRQRQCTDNWKLLI